MRRITVLLVLLMVLSACGKKNQRKVEVVEPEPEGPTAQELFVKANRSLEKSDWPAAIEYYDDAVEVDPNHWEAHMNRGIALSRLGKFSPAIDAFNSALKAGGDKHAIFFFNLGNLYQDRGMYSEAIDAYRMALSVGDARDVDTLLNLAAAYVFIRRYDDAVATYEYLRTVAPDDARPVHGLGLVSQVNEQFAVAVQHYEDAHAIDPSYALSYYNKSRCLAAMGEWDRAIDTLQAYKQMDTSDAMKRRAETLIRVYETEKTKQP